VTIEQNIKALLAEDIASDPLLASVMAGTEPDEPTHAWDVLASVYRRLQAHQAALIELGAAIDAMGDERKPDS
jgi:hypothetical protein